ncbi:MAG: TatD family hydrolase [Bacteroidota bacterium]
MQLVDSHAHIYLNQFDSDLEDTIERAREEGVEAIYMPNIDHTSIDDMLEVSEKYPGYCIPMMGLHPTSVKKGFEKELYLVEEWLNKGGFSAVGEIGTDLYWDQTYWQEQQEALKIQLELAIKHELPFVIHCRDSIDETIELIKPLQHDKLRGVFHCFTGTIEQATQITSMGFKLGIGGVATFKNGGLENVLEETASEQILLETDSPYLAPVPYRGKRNEPSYIINVCEKIASVKRMDASEVGRITSANAVQLFKPVI